MAAQQVGISSRHISAFSQGFAQDLRAMALDVFARGPNHIYCTDTVQTFGQ